MKIELTIEGGNLILLTPVRKIDYSNTNRIYELRDEDNDVWMEVRLNENRFDIVSKNSLIIDEEDDLEIKLDQLILEVLESEQSGTENTDTEVAEEASPYNPDKIKVNSKQFSIKLIEEMIENKDIDLSPDFQRNYVWTSIQKSRLIESILLRIPLPMFYFSEDDEGKISVVDGLQRLTTIKDFIDNKFALKNLEYLADSCEGRFYSSKNKDGSPNGKLAIDQKYFRWFNMTQISVNVIDPTSPPKVKYDIFRRINTGGKALNSQEIRNCLATKELRSTLKKMTSLLEFKKATDLSIKPKRMDDQEVALRFILFWRLKYLYEVSLYNGYMDSSLDDLTEELANASSEEFERYVFAFSNAMKNAEYLFGRKYAFRKVTPHDLKPDAYKQLINKALFVSCSVSLANYDHQIIVKQNKEKALLEPLANEIFQDRQLMNYLSYGTNSRANVIYAFKSVEKVISENLNYNLDESKD